MARPTGASMPERIPALERRVARVEDAVDRIGASPPAGRRSVSFPALD
jgi:hypothetical protein